MKASHLQTPASTPIASSLRLHQHPATPCPIDLQIAVVLTQPVQEGMFRLEFVATGDIHRLCIPQPAASPKHAEGLWQHTCFEAFVANSTGAGYQEFNFSPSGDWANYNFVSERELDALHMVQRPTHITVSKSPASLGLSVQLPRMHCNATSSWGFSAVIELDNGSLSYWALHHPKAHPDFHHRSGWTFEWPYGHA